MTKNQEIQRIIKLYRDRTGESQIDMHKVVAFAVKELGYPLPEPVQPIDILAKKFSVAAREETNIDAKTGRPYRVNHAVTEWQGGKQLTFWIDIDRAPRKLVVKSFMRRREQMVGDAYQLTLDLDHWNSINPQEEPVFIPLDLTEDVEERKNAPPMDEAA